MIISISINQVSQPNPAIVALKTYFAPTGEPTNHLFKTLEELFKETPELSDARVVRKQNDVEVHGLCSDEDAAKAIDEPPDLEEFRSMPFVEAATLIHLGDQIALDIAIHDDQIPALVEVLRETLQNLREMPQLKKTIENGMQKLHGISRRLAEDVAETLDELGELHSALGKFSGDED